MRTCSRAAADLPPSGAGATTPTRDRATRRWPPRQRGAVQPATGCAARACLWRGPLVILTVTIQCLLAPARQRVDHFGFRRAPVERQLQQSHDPLERIPDARYLVISSTFPLLLGALTVQMGADQFPDYASGPHELPSAVCLPRFHGISAVRLLCVHDFAIRLANYAETCDSS